MIFEIVQHLMDSPLADSRMTQEFTYERDDDFLPFSDLTTRPVVVRAQGAPADRDVTQGNFDIWLHTQGNAEHSHTNQLFQDARELQNWLLQNFSYGRIGNIVINAGPAGPFRDGQQRRYVTLSITAFRSSGG